jgi:hypothetical protein
LIGGQCYADDFEVIWRGMSIGRIVRASGLPPHVPANGVGRATYFGKSGGASRSGVDLDDSKSQFRAAWARIRAGGANRYAEASAEALARYDRKR